jgi:NADH-quinone oxidoreductase subunit J
MMAEAAVLVHLLAATRPDALVFVWTSVVIIAGAFGVVLSRNPVHSALMLVMTLFGVAVIFIELQANFLAAVQVIVYAGAIVVLFLFVIMLLGVDKQENLETEPLRGQRPIAIVLVLLALGGVLALGIESHWAVGAHAVAGPRNQSGGDVAALGRSVFTTYLFPFEVTSALLVIAVVGAVVLSRQTRGTQSSDPEAGASAGSDPIGEGDSPTGTSEEDELTGSADESGQPDLITANAPQEAEAASAESPSEVAGSDVSSAVSSDVSSQEVRT